MLHNDVDEFTLDKDNLPGFFASEPALSAGVGQGKALHLFFIGVGRNLDGVTGLAVE